MAARNAELKAKLAELQLELFKGQARIKEFNGRFKEGRRSIAIAAFGLSKGTDSYNPAPPPAGTDEFDADGLPAVGAIGDYGLEGSYDNVPLEPSPPRTPVPEPEPEPEPKVFPTSPPPAPAPTGVPAAASPAQATLVRVNDAKFKKMYDYFSKDGKAAKGGFMIADCKIVITEAAKAVRANPDESILKLEALLEAQQSDGAAIVVKTVSKEVFLSFAKSVPVLRKAIELGVDLKKLDRSKIGKTKKDLKPRPKRPEDKHEDGRFQLKRGLRTTSVLTIKPSIPVLDPNAQTLARAPKKAGGIKRMTRHHVSFTKVEKPGQNAESSKSPSPSLSKSGVKMGTTISNPLFTAAEDGTVSNPLFQGSDTDDDDEDADTQFGFDSDASDESSDQDEDEASNVKMASTRSYDPLARPNLAAGDRKLRAVPKPAPAPTPAPASKRVFHTEAERRQAEADPEATAERLKGMSFDFNFG